MLTKTQIQRLAQRHGVGVQVQERDYLQHLLLWRLYARSQKLVFKEGAALRLVYGGNRYSEDLDFNGPADRVALDALWQQVIADLAGLGVAAEIREPWDGEVGDSFDASSLGPLCDGRDRSRGKVRGL
jgi:predicted nucleotidyltransferase component of viral defense system